MSIATRVVHGAKVCLIPMPANQDRPLALRHKPLAAISGLLIVAKVLAAGVILLTPASADLSTITTARIIQLTNAERKKAGLNELKVNSKLTSAAVQKGNHMLQEDYFAHISPSGVTPWFWMSKVGYTYRIAGENLAIDFIEAEDVVAAWLASPTHRDNMLQNQYTETGVGVVTGEFEGGTSTVVVHMFGLPTENQPAVEPEAAIPSPTPAVKASTTKSSPTPTPASSPAPAPSDAPPADTTPPRIPRIAVLSSVASSQALVKIDGDPGSTVQLLLNNQPRHTVTLDSNGKAEYELSLEGFPDGTLVLRAYSVDQASNQSELSEPLALTKDTQGPQLARSDISFVLSPLTDSPRAVFTVDSNQYVSGSIHQNNQEYAFTSNTNQVIDANSPLTLALVDQAGNSTKLPDVSLAPTFTLDSDQGYLAPPARFSQLTRRLTAVIFATILALLILAILIRVRIQHPALIAHASFVLVLAGCLFIL